MMKVYRDRLKSRILTAPKPRGSTIAKAPVPIQGPLQSIEPRELSRKSKHDYSTDLGISEEQQAEKAVHFGWINIFISIGFIIGPLMGGLLADPTVVSWFTFATPFWVAACMTVIGMGVIYRYSKETLQYKKKDLLRNRDSVDFRVLLSRVFDSFCGACIKLCILSPQKESKIDELFIQRQSLRIFNETTSSGCFAQSQALIIAHCDFCHAPLLDYRKSDGDVCFGGFV